jgi:hypothetical protein
MLLSGRRCRCALANSVPKPGSIIVLSGRRYLVSDDGTATLSQPGSGAVMEVVLNNPRGFADVEFRDCVGHDPRPGLEWDRPVVLNGEVGEVVQCHRGDATLKLSRRRR